MRRGGLDLNSQSQLEIRFGLIALTLAELFFALGIVLRGTVDLTDPGSFFRTALSPTYVAGWTVITAGGVLLLYGLFGLYRYLTLETPSRITFLAFVLSIAGIALLLPLTAFLALNGPVIAELDRQGNAGVMAIVAANFTSPLSVALLAVSSTAGVIGAVLFGVAIWRRGKQPRWTGPIYVLGTLGQAIPVTFITEVVGTVLVLVVASVIVWKAWPESPASS